MTNLMKTAAAAVAIALAAPAAYAGGTFNYQTAVNDDSIITIDSLRVDSDGYVAIYAYSNGEVGELLGSAPVMAGANVDVKVSLDETLTENTVAAYLFEGEVTTPDQAVDMINIDVTM